METIQTSNGEAPDNRYNPDTSTITQYLGPKIDLQRAIEKFVYWIGLICAAVGLLAYVIIVTIMMTGFKAGGSWTTDIIFALISGFVGVLTMQFLKVQGSTFARHEPETKKWLDLWNSRRTKDRKYHNMNYFWIRSTAIDVLFKFSTILIITAGSIYIFIEASGDAMRVLMAFFNILMFIGFGLHALSKAYTFMRTEHVQWIQVQLEDKIKEDKEKADVEDARQMEIFKDSLHGYVLAKGYCGYMKQFQEEQELRDFVDRTHAFVLSYSETICPAIPPAADTLRGEETVASEPSQGGISDGQQT